MPLLRSLGGCRYRRTAASPRWPPPSLPAGNAWPPVEAAAPVPITTRSLHKHPSGDPSPSAEDILLTRRLSEVGELVGIRVLDHLVVGERGSYRSLADDGVLGGAR